MSEIEKMMQNAGFVKKRCKDYSCGVCEQYDKCEKYPPFTAEKQIELIKWVLTSKNTEILKFEVINGKYEVYDTYYECDKYRESLDEALADYICCLWQDLTEQDRTEIAYILK